MLLTSRAKHHSPKKLQEAFQMVSTNYTQLMQTLEDLMLLSASELIPFAEALMLDLYRLLNADVPRRILQIVNQLWMLLNTVMPRRLWVMTVNALQPKAKLLRQQKYTQNDLMVDPLIVLRCDRRVYRCPPLMDITLHMLNGYLLASKAYLSAHLKENVDQDSKPYQNNTMGVMGQPEAPEVTREELKNALLSAQDSAAVQILLEICLPTDKERSHSTGKILKQQDQSSSLSESLENTQENLLSNVREVQCLICCLLHQMFIADPNIAKLVHFQIFAIQLLSHLCIQYALPKSLSVARLSINVMGTVLTVLTQAKRFAFFMPTLPCLVSFCRAFPPLYDDVASLLIQTGQVCASHVATQAQDIDPIITRLKYLKEKTEVTPDLHRSVSSERIKKGETIAPESLDPDVLLCQRVEATFLEIINTAVVGV
ncbi:hypothetical protein scyTo_0002591 [Scyliorhinus torazame]|uniref:Integrator complex subunit 2 n=1 Tax=Scyliorhinus torazame TaxID=75743 RepID=A0A401PK62_SCYTO|nr:hypothetical protein [Scyliorhinus torazame]